MCVPLYQRLLRPTISPEKNYCYSVERFGLMFDGKAGKRGEYDPNQVSIPYMELVTIEIFAHSTAMTSTFSGVLQKKIIWYLNNFDDSVNVTCLVFDMRKGSTIANPVYRKNCSISLNFLYITCFMQSCLSCLNVIFTCVSQSNCFQLHTIASTHTLQAKSSVKIFFGECQSSAHETIFHFCIFNIMSPLSLLSMSLNRNIHRGEKIQL